MRDCFFFFFLFPLLFASINIIPTLCILFIGIKSPVPLYHLYSLIPVVLFTLYIYLSRFIACFTTKDNLFTTCLSKLPLAHQTCLLHNECLLVCFIQTFDTYVHSFNLEF